MFDILNILLKMFFAVILIWVLASYIFTRRKKFGAIYSRWHHPFTDVQFSSKDFYASVKANIESKNIPNIAIDTVEYNQGDILLSKRTYLQVTRQKQQFLICAAPFGKDYFFSWWFGETNSFTRDLITRIPRIGLALERLIYTKTFYQLDTDTMFKEAVRSSVLKAIDALTDTHGVRGMTELERTPVDAPFQRSA